MTNLSLIAFLALALNPSAAYAGCVSGDFVLDVKGSCSYAALLKSFSVWFAQPGNIAPGCTSSAEQELTSLLAAGSGNASTAVNAICAGAFANYTKVPFATSTGADDRFVEEFFKGSGDWNEQVATLFPVYDGVVAAGEPTESMLLKRDADTVSEFYDEEGRRSIVAVPNLPNFDKCGMNSAYCCWPKDRQAQDNNGNCNLPYDSRCVDADPADNTDLCFLNQADGAKSTGSKASEGWLTFPFDDGSNQFSAEGPIHCHGFAWADDTNDPSFVYRGNSLFFVSLYDHMYARGYVKNIPGAPMCACAEQMPTVSRADCTQIDFENDEHNFKFTFRNNAFSAKLVKVFIKFNACKGIDEDGAAKNNDLWSYMNRLYLDSKVSGEKLQALTQKLVGSDNCHVGEVRGLNKNNVTRGYKQLDDKWTILRGKDALDNNRYYGKEAFNYLVDASSTKPAILVRACASCYFDQQWLWYKRLTPIPAGFDLWNQLQFSGQDSSTGTVGNKYGVDFNIYGSYEDALDNKNAWKCPGYSYGDGFPGNCAPYGGTRRDQGGFFEASWSKPDVAWFLENKGRVLNALPQTESKASTPSKFGSFYDMVAINLGANKIPGQAYVEGSGNTMFMTASGADISGKSDNFKFAYKRTSGDVTMVVRVKTMDTREQWGKAGLLIRESLAPGAKVFGVVLHGKMSVVNLYRATADDWMQFRGEQPGVSNSIWLKLTKRTNEFTAYKSADGVSWTIVGTPQMLSMNSTDLRIGLGLTSATNWRQIEATFDNFDTSNYYFPSAAPSQSAAPSRDIPYTPARDIGRTYDKRYPSDVGLQKSKYIIKGAGYDLWGSEDSFSFVNFTVTGDFDMTARVTSVLAINSWAKFGLMARDSLDPKSKNLFNMFAPYQGTLIQIRNQYGGATSSINWVGDKPKTVWLRLKREGGVFNASKSLVGTKLAECTWQLIQSFDATAIAFNSTTLQIGMAVTSHNPTEYAIAEFDQFKITTSSQVAGGATTTGAKRGLRSVE